MRLLVLSDIHSNGTALAAVLRAAEGRYERVVCLGDLVGYGPDPNEVIDQIRNLNAPVIRGNHDKAAAGLTDLEDFNELASVALDWTRSQLSPRNMAYLQNLPAGPVETDGIVFVHGSPRDEDEYIFSPSQALEILLSASAPLTFYGHTHIQGGFALDGDFLEVILLRAHRDSDFAPLRLHRETRYLLNPGSIGQPRDGDPRAAFAIADLDHAVVEFWRVPYDIAAVQERMTEAGAPEALVARLGYGS